MKETGYFLVSSRNDGKDGRGSQEVDRGNARDDRSTLRARLDRQKGAGGRARGNIVVVAAARSRASCSRCSSIRIRIRMACSYFANSPFQLRPGPEGVPGLGCFRHRPANGSSSRRADSAPACTSRRSIVICIMIDCCSNLQLLPMLVPGGEP